MKNQFKIFSGFISLLMVSCVATTGNQTVPNKITISTTSIPSASPVPQQPTATSTPVLNPPSTQTPIPVSSPQTIMS